jgi:predicted small secreted protein
MRKVMLGIMSLLLVGALLLSGCGKNESASTGGTAAGSGAPIKLAPGISRSDFCP